MTGSPNFSRDDTISYRIFIGSEGTLSAYSNAGGWSIFGQSVLSSLILRYIIVFIAWTSAGCTAHFFWFFFNKPHDLPIVKRGNYYSQHDYLNSNVGFLWIRRKTVVNAYYLFVFIGVGYCIFCGIEATLQWLPKSWASVSDEGDDPLWVGYTLAGIAAFFASLWLLGNMERLALDAHLPLSSPAGKGSKEPDTTRLHGR